MTTNFFRRFPRFEILQPAESAGCPGPRIALFCKKIMIRPLILLCILTKSVTAGWQIHNVPEVTKGDYHSPERVTMTYDKNVAGHETLTEALLALKAQGKIGKLDFIRPHPFTEEDEFQRELIAAFKELAPEDWAAAERSAGNMHSPKIRALRRYLSEAFIRTSLAKEISRDLAPYGMVITEFGQEKLSYEQVHGKRMIRAIFHVSVAPKKEAEQAGAGQPATRPESKSEGGHKPQPEAEGRSR